MMPSRAEAEKRKARFQCVYCPASTTHGQRRCPDCKAKERMRERMLKTGVDRMGAYSLADAWRIGVTGAQGRVGSGRGNFACRNCGGAYQKKPGKWENPLFCSESCEIMCPEVTH